MFTQWYQATIGRLEAEKDLNRCDQLIKEMRSIAQNNKLTKGSRDRLEDLIRKAEKRRSLLIEQIELNDDAEHILREAERYKTTRFIAGYERR